MSKTLLALALTFSFQPQSAPPAADAEAANRVAVERAVRDYVEALYQAKPELIERSVHPALEKSGLYRPENTASYRTPGKMTFDQLRELAGHWNKDGKEGTNLKYDIQVLDRLDVTASAKLSAKWGVDYMHLAKLGGEWKIVQILWQSPPPTR